jgi:hypothetical protein
MHDACQVGKSSRVHHCLVPYPTIRPRGASRSSFPPRARRTSLNFCLSWASAIRLELSERWAPQLLLRLFFYWTLPPSGRTDMGGGPTPCNRPFAVDKVSVSPPPMSQKGGQLRLCWGTCTDAPHSWWARKERVKLCSQTV